MPYPATVDAGLTALYINVKDGAYGAKGDGVSDDTAAIAAARSTANAAGGGTVYYPPGTYITGNQTLYPFVADLGSGIGTTMLKLKAGANTDLFSAATASINLSAVAGASVVGTLLSFSLRHMTLDGNNSNQTSGPSYPLRFYGRNFLLENLNIQNGYSGGILCDWNGGAGITGINDQMEARFINMKIHDNLGTGLQIGGPHDSQLHNVIVYDSKYHGMHFAPNAVACQVLNPHVYSCTAGQGGVACLCEAQSVVFINPSFEGGDVGQVAALANEIQILGGRLFFQALSTTWGLKVGQLASETPIIGQILQSVGVTTAVAPALGTYFTEIAECDGTHGSVWYDNDGGNYFDLTIYQTSGVQSTGTPNSGSEYHYRGTATPYTLYTPGIIKNPVFTATPTGGTAIQTSPNSSIAFLMDPGSDGNKGIVVFAHSGAATGNLLELQNGSYVPIFTVSPSGNTAVGGMLSTGQSATAAAVATAGTITTAGIGEARVSPTGAVTGVILQAGTVAGQEVWVVNEAIAANTVTFAVAATSHVADGVSSVIAGLRAAKFKWDSSTSLWYRG